MREGARPRSDLSAVLLGPLARSRAYKHVMLELVDFTASSLFTRRSSFDCSRELSPPPLRAPRRLTFLRLRSVRSPTAALRRRAETETTALVGSLNIVVDNMGVNVLCVTVTVAGVLIA